MSYRNMLEMAIRPGAPVWTARAIYTRPGERPDLVPDRKRMAGDDPEQRRALGTALDAGPLRAFLGVVVQQRPDPAKYERVAVEGRGPGAVTIRGTPNASYGYLYLCACFSGDLG